MSNPLFRYYKKGDTGEPLSIKIVSASDGQAVALGATATFYMYEVNDDGTLIELVNAPATISATEDGLVTYNWQAGDTDTVGTHMAEFKVEIDTGELEKYPRQGYIEIRIQEDLAT